MPSTKKAKDSAEERAETIGAELTFLAGFSHPTQVKQEIKSYGTKVVNFHATLYDSLVDGSISSQDRNFMESMGRVIALNWFIGQGVLNITNILVQNFWNKICCPYNLDYCFKSTVDLDSPAVGYNIIHETLVNLRNSAESLGINTENFDKLFFIQENLSAIIKGFNEQLIKLSKILPENIFAIVEKYTHEETEREAYNKFFADKTQQAKVMALTHIKELLQGYIRKVKENGFAHGFFIMPGARAKNREINYLLAKTYLESIDSGAPLNFDRQTVLEQREKIKLEKKGAGRNILKSEELEEIFSLAAHFTANTTETFNSSLRATTQEIKVSEVDVVAHVIGRLPSNPLEIPDQFFQIDSADIEALLELEVIENKPLKYQVNPGTEVTKNLLADLNRLKKKLGGAPNFRHGIPTLDDEDAHRTFMGQPMSAVKDWFRMTLKKEWRPQFFWIFIAKLFNVTSNLTSYEETHIRIQRFGILLANKDRFIDILDRKDSSQYVEFQTITGLAWHPEDNSPGVEKFYIRMLNDFLTVYYEDAKNRGDEALLEYYESFQGVCFEDRVKIMEQYMASHPTLEMEAKIKAMGESELEISPLDMACYDKDASLEQVIYAECGELTAIRKGISPKPQDLWEHLLKKGLVGREFPKTHGNSEKIKITVEYLNTDEVRAHLINVVMVLDNGPKIIAAIEMSSLENIDDTPILGMDMG